MTTSEWEIVMTKSNHLEVGGNMAALAIGGPALSIVVHTPRNHTSGGRVAGFARRIGGGENTGLKPLVTAEAGGCSMGANQREAVRSMLGDEPLWSPIGFAVAIFAVAPQLSKVHIFVATSAALGGKHCNRAAIVVAA